MSNKCWMPQRNLWQGFQILVFKETPMQQSVLQSSSSCGGVREMLSGTFLSFGTENEDVLPVWKQHGESDKFLNWWK